MVQVPLPLVNKQPARIPPLENGDRLSRDEFERRYAEWPDSRAELIEGIVYMAAALRFRSHGKPHSQLNGWLWAYQMLMPGTELADAPSVRLDSGNEPQPDLVLIWDADRGGQTRISTDDYIEGAPEFIAEISASTVSIDLGSKKTAYERNGVQEYLVWRVLDQEIDWFWLENDRYSLLQADDDGITRSRIFPGLWLDRSVLLRGEMNRVLDVVRQGVAEIQK